VAIQPGLEQIPSQFTAGIPSASSGQALRLRGKDRRSAQDAVGVNQIGKRYGPKLFPRQPSTRRPASAAVPYWPGTPVSKNMPRCLYTRKAVPTSEVAQTFGWPENSEAGNNRLDKLP
jgi:hypothetical protein